MPSSDATFEASNYGAEGGLASLSAGTCDNSTLIDPNGALNYGAAAGIRKNITLIDR